MDLVLKQSVVYGVVTVALLSPKLAAVLPSRFAKPLHYFRRPVLTAILMYLFYLPIYTERPNFYALLEVDIHANKNDIIQAYRSASKKYHPDKIATSGIQPPFSEGLSPEEYFMGIKRAQEVLTHDIRKSFYDRFGDLKEVGELDDKIAIIAVCLSLAAHMIAFTVSFLLSQAKHVCNSCQIFLIYIIAVFCIEIQQRFVEEDDSLNFLPCLSGLLPFEKILYFRALIPFVLVASLCHSSWQYYDRPARHWAILKALLSTNRVLNERTQELLRATVYLKTMGTPSVAALKAAGEYNQKISAAVRTKAAGINVAGQETAQLPENTSRKAKATELENFAALLSEEQLEQFKLVIAEEYRKTEVEDKALEKERLRRDINWSQYLLWAGLFLAWMYYK